MNERALFEPDVFGSPPKRWAWVIGVFLVVAVVIATTASAFIALRFVMPVPVPSVDQLAAHYCAHRQAFDDLARISSIHDRFVIDLKRHAVDAPEFDAKTLESAKAALRSIGAERAECVDGELEVIIGSEGLAVSGVDWGYHHSSIPLSETVSIEVARSEAAPDLWYCPLGDNWYAMTYRF